MQSKFGVRNHEKSSGLDHGSRIRVRKSVNRAEMNYVNKLTYLDGCLIAATSTLNTSEFYR